MEPVTVESGGSEAQAREEVLAAIYAAGPFGGGADGCRGVPGLEHLARALTALRGRGTTQEGDTDAAAGLQMTGPGQERSGGRKVGLALER